MYPNASRDVKMRPGSRGDKRVAQAIRLDRTPDRPAVTGKASRRRARHATRKLSTSAISVAVTRVRWSLRDRCGALPAHTASHRNGLRDTVITRSIVSFMPERMSKWL